MMKFLFLGIVAIILAGSTHAGLINTLESENATCEHDPSKLSAVYVSTYYLDADDELLQPSAQKIINYEIDVKGELTPSFNDDAVLGNGWFTIFETNGFHQSSVPAYTNLDGTPTSNIAYFSDFVTFGYFGKQGMLPNGSALKSGVNTFKVTMNSAPNVPMLPGDAVYFTAIVSCFTPQELSQENVIYPDYPLLTPEELADLSPNFCHQGYHLEYDQGNNLVCIADEPVEVPEFGEWVVLMLFAGCVIIAVSRRK